MLRRYRFAFGPSWILLHLLTVGACVSMVLLGRWQLHVSESKHFSLQNFGYAIQWWLFCGFALFFWSRIMRDGLRRVGAPTRASDATKATRPDAEAQAPGPVAYRRYVMPTDPEPPNDPVHEAYNDYLARLAAEDTRHP